MAPNAARGICALSENSNKGACVDSGAEAHVFPASEYFDIISSDKIKLTNADCGRTPRYGYWGELKPKKLKFLRLLIAPPLAELLYPSLNCKKVVLLVLLFFRDGHRPGFVLKAPIPMAISS